MIAKYMREGQREGRMDAEEEKEKRTRDFHDEGTGWGDRDFAAVHFYRAGHFAKASRSRQADFGNITNAKWVGKNADDGLRAP